MRQWLIEHGFQGKEGQQIPEMTDAVVKSISERYIELFEKVTGDSFEKPAETDPLKRIENHINQYISKLRIES